MLRTPAQDNVCRKASEVTLPIPLESAPSAKAEQSSRQGPFSELDRGCGSSPGTVPPRLPSRWPPGLHQVQPRTCGTPRAPALGASLGRPNRHAPEGHPCSTPGPAFLLQGAHAGPREHQRPQLHLVPPPEGLHSLTIICHLCPAALSTSWAPAGAAHRGGSFQAVPSRPPCSPGCSRRAKGTVPPPPPTPAPGPPCLPLPGLARLPLPRTCCAKHRRPQASSYIRVVPTHPRQPICAFFLSVDTTQQSAARRRLDPAVRKSAPVLVHGDLHTSLPTCSSLQSCCTGPTPPVKSEGAEPRQAAPAPPQPPRPRLRAGCYGSDAPFRSSVWKLGEALQKEAGSYPVTRQRRGFHTCWSQKASAEREGASSSHHGGLSNLPSCVSTAGPSGPRT